MPRTGCGTQTAPPIVVEGGLAVWVPHTVFNFAELIRGL